MWSSAFFAGHITQFSVDFHNFPFSIDHKARGQLLSLSSRWQIAATMCATSIKPTALVTRQLARLRWSCRPIQLQITPECKSDLLFKIEMQVASTQHTHSTHNTPKGTTQINSFFRRQFVGVTMRFDLAKMRWQIWHHLFRALWVFFAYSVMQIKTLPSCLPLPRFWPAAFCEFNKTKIKEMYAKYFNCRRCVGCWLRNTFPPRRRQRR